MTVVLTDSQIHEAHLVLEQALYEMKHVVVGQSVLLERLIIALLVQGHVLVEGAPGLAKTLALKTLSQVTELDFKRIQFTPDLLPSDLIGTRIYNPVLGTFTTEKGPLFSHFILADEINRAPAKVQSALLEAMQEQQVTIGHETFILPPPFFVMATQNPLESEGTYPLPEAQLDRFLFKVLVDYPSHDEELVILERVATQGLASPKRILDREELLALNAIAQQVFIEPGVMSFIVNLVQTSRQNSAFAYGASPRGTLSLASAARGLALLNGRGYVKPRDVQAVAKDCLRHRCILSYEALSKGLSVDHVLEEILEEQSSRTQTTAQPV